MSEPKSEPAPAPAKSSKVMPILLGLNSLLMVGVVGFMGYSMMKKPAPAPTEEHGEEASGEGGADEHEKAPAEKHEKAEKSEKKGEAKKEEGKHEGAEHAPSAAGAPGPLVRISDFVVHLRNPDLDRYARVTFEIEVFTEADKERLTASIPRVRDAFISYLSDRTVEELRGSDGLGRTKDALQQRLRDLVPDVRIRALYISDFVVQ